MKRFSLINLFLLTVVYLTFVSAEGIAFGNDLTIYNNTDYTLYVALGWKDNITQESVTSYPSGGMASSISIVGNTEHISGWWSIEPNSKRTFNKGSGECYVNMHIVRNGSWIDMSPSYDVYAYAWVHDDAFDCVTRVRFDPNGGMASSSAIGGDLLYDDYLWDKSWNNYDGYRHYFSINYDGMGRTNYTGSSISKHSPEWLKNELNNKGWVKKTFYMVPYNKSSITINY